MSEWFHRVMGQELGPVSDAQLKAVARDGTIQRDTFIRKGRDGSWTTAAHVKGLFSKPPEMPHASGSPSSSHDLSDDEVPRFMEEAQPSVRESGTPELPARMTMRIAWGKASPRVRITVLALLAVVVAVPMLCIAMSFTPHARLKRAAISEVRQLERLELEAKQFARLHHSNPTVMNQLDALVAYRNMEAQREKAVEACERLAEYELRRGWEPTVIKYHMQYAPP
jgi:hypothetical protein